MTAEKTPTKFLTEPNQLVWQTFPAEGPAMSTDSQEFQDFIELSYQCPAENFSRINIVHNNEHKLTDDDGGSFGISSALDRRILRLIRSFADAVYMGAATIRAEGWMFPKTGAMMAVLVGNSPIALPSGSDKLPLYVFQSELVEEFSADDRDRLARFVPTSGTLAETVKLVTETLYADGYSSIVCEGGVQVAEAALAQGLIDEIAVTISPIESAGTVILDEDYTEGFHLVQELVAEDGFRFQRWQRS